MTKSQSPAVGVRFGMLVVQERLPGRKFRCLCDCGNEHIVYDANLRTRTNSCGCLARKLVSERSTTHGMSKSPDYNVWNSMIMRCCNENSTNYDRYGAKGITVCDRWRGPGGFDNFLEDMGKRPYPGATLDRIDNNGNYEPGNVRWATMVEQSRNRATNLLIEFNGETRFAVDVAKEHGIGRSCFNMRHNKYGWDIVRAATQPIEGRYKNRWAHLKAESATKG